MTMRLTVDDALVVGDVVGIVVDVLVVDVVGVGGAGVGLVIDTVRQFSSAARCVRAGRWPVDGMYRLTRQVSNTRVGIIGLGRIGGAIAKRLSAFGCAISYHNTPQPPRPTGNRPDRDLACGLFIHGQNVLAVFG